MIPPFKSSQDYPLSTPLDVSTTLWILAPFGDGRETILQQIF